MSVREKIEKLKSELSSRPVRIIAVTKYATVEQIKEAYDAGLNEYGESKLQVFNNKWSDLPDEVKENAIWHYIGHLQSNKVKKVIGVFQLIHSVDSLKLAKVISKEAEEINLNQEILLQVNISQEASKYGFYKEDLKQIFPELLGLSNIRIRGLMTMAPLTSDQNTIRQTFQGLRELKEELQNVFNYSLPDLSMGMSSDYQIAVDEGSTIIRVGQKIFT